VRSEPVETIDPTRKVARLELSAAPGTIKR
jgi:hypothetical protein